MVKSAAAGLRSRVHRLAEVEVGELAAVSVVGISLHHMQGRCAACGLSGDLGSAVPAAGRHRVAHRLGEAGQQPAARVAHSLSIARRPPGTRAR
jgi:hypothetical protein